MAQLHAVSGQAVNVLAAWPTKTTAVLKAECLEVVRLALPAGTRMPRHAAPGEITLLAIRGRMSLLLDRGTIRMCAGDFLHLEAGEPHAVEAHDDVQVLLTLCLHPAARDTAAR
jgi:quercetin dioxygenase-like cupin family protein